MYNTKSLEQLPCNSGSRAEESSRQSRRRWMGAAPSASPRNPWNADFDVLELRIERPTPKTPMGIMMGFTMGHAFTRQTSPAVPAVVAIAITTGKPFHSAGVQFGDRILSVSGVPSVDPAQVAGLIRDAGEGPLSVRIARPRSSHMQPLRITLPSIMISEICFDTSAAGATVCPLPSSDVLQSSPLTSGDVVLQVGTERPQDAEHARSLLKGWTGASVHMVVVRPSLQTLGNNIWVQIFVFKSSAGQALGVELSSHRPWTRVHALHGQSNVLVDAGLSLQDVICSVNGESVNGHEHAAALLRRAVGRVEILIQRERADALRCAAGTQGSPCQGLQHDALQQASKAGELGDAHSQTSRV